MVELVFIVKFFFGSLMNMCALNNYHKFRYLMTF